MRLRADIATAYPSAQTVAPRAPDAPPPASDIQPNPLIWRRFLARARVDVETLKKEGPKLKPSVVILGGSDTETAAQTRELARALGRALGAAGLPIRTPDRGGAIADLVVAARDAKSDLRVESIDTDNTPNHVTDLRIPTLTREIGKRALVAKASAYLVLPGGIESLWDLHQVWTLLRAHMIPERPLILVGDKAYWDAVLDTLIAPALKEHTVKAEYLKCLTFVPTVEEGVRLAAEAHGRFGKVESRELEEFLPLVEDDIENLPKVMRNFVRGGIVAYGGAGLEPGSEDYEALKKLGESIVAPVTTGGGPGIMAALPEGAKERDPNAETQALNIKLPTEQKLNQYIDKARAGEGRTLEIRERLIMSADGSSSVFGAGGTGTWVELYQVWRLMADGELPKRPVFLTGFYRPHLEAFLRAAGERGFLSPDIKGLLTICDDFDDLQTKVQAARDAFVASDGR